MIKTKQSILKPLIESQNGIHLTSYIPTDRGHFSVKTQIKEVIEVAKEYLSPVMKEDEMNRFLEPISSLLNEMRLIKQIKGNIGIFRTKDSFRLLSIPIDVELTCVVATSFHVKPLLKWMQTDRDFLLFGIEETSASLYYGTQHNFELIDTILFPQPNKKLHGQTQTKKMRLMETLDWINEWLLSMTKESKPLLFVAGDPILSRRFRDKIKYPQIVETMTWPSFNSQKALDICSQIRSLLKKEARKKLESSIVEFYHAEDLNLAKKNIFQIAKAAISGRVKKLIIADGISIFGKLDKKTGGIVINPTDMDHEDDDLLDDLAQTVLSYGGEVIVAQRDEIPKGHPILAILENSNTELSNYLNSEIRVVS